MKSLGVMLSLGVALGCAPLPGVAYPIKGTGTSSVTTATDPGDSAENYEWNSNYLKVHGDYAQGSGWAYCEKIELASRKRAQVMHTFGWLNGIGAALATGAVTVLGATTPDDPTLGRKAAVAAMAPSAALMAAVSIAMFNRSEAFSALAEGVLDQAADSASSKEARKKCQKMLARWHQSRSGAVLDNK